MTRHRRADPHYRHLEAWEPTRPSLAGDLAEAAITGLLVGGAILGLDYVIVGTWADLGSCAFVVLGCVAVCWIRLRWLAGRQADPLPEPEPPPRDRLVMVNPKPPEALDQADQDRRRSEFDTFVIRCERTTALRDYERLGVSRADYEQWRDMLIRLGWAEWRSQDHRQGWELTAEPSEVLAALE